MHMAIISSGIITLYTVYLKLNKWTNPNTTLTEKQVTKRWGHQQPRRGNSGSPVVLCVWGFVCMCVCMCARLCIPSYWSFLRALKCSHFQQQFCILQLCVLDDAFTVHLSSLHEQNDFAQKATASQSAWITVTTDTILQCSYSMSVLAWKYPR